MNLIRDLARLRVLPELTRPFRPAMLAALLTPRAQLLQTIELISSAEERLRTYARMEQASGQMNVTIPWWAAMQALTRLIGAVEVVLGLPGDVVLRNLGPLLMSESFLRAITVQLASLSRAAEPAGAQSITLPSTAYAQILDAIAQSRAALNGVAAALQRS